MARARDEADAEAFQVVVRVVERMDLELASIARAGVDVAYRQRLAQRVEDLAVDVAVPGCPPPPLEIMRGILAAVRRRR